MVDQNYIPHVNTSSVEDDHALLDLALSLGGHVAMVDLDEFHQALESYLTRHNPIPEEPAQALAAGAPERVPLSMMQISPFIEYRAGASLLKAHKGGIPKQPKGGKRKPIDGFSPSARRRLMAMIAGVRRDAPLPMFITLTYPEVFPDPKTSKRHLDTFFKRFKRAFPAGGSIWKLEPQQRGAPHFHIMTWGCDLLQVMQFVPQAWFEIAGSNDQKHLMWHCGELGNQHCVQQVRKFEGVRSYASKYLGKTFEVAGWQGRWTGRYWGVINRGAVPLGELVRSDLTRHKAIEVIRYQRRFASLKKFSNNKSLTIFCDVDQWINKLDIVK